MSLAELTTQKLPFEVNTTIGLKNIATASDCNAIQRNMFWLRSVLVLWDVQLCFELNRSINSKWQLCHYYRWTEVSTGNTFQDLPRLRKTTDNTERYM